MKTTSRTIKLMLAFCLTFILPLATIAAPAIYVCSTGSVTLAYTGDYTLITGDQVIWQKVDATGTPIPGSAPKVNIYNGTPGSENLTVTGGTELNAPGDHYWVVHVVSTSGASCTGDVSDPINVYMLPAYTVEVTPTSGSYCSTGSTNTTPLVITALAKPANSFTLPGTITYKYDWVTAPGTGVGAPDATNPEKFNMTTTTVGTYTVTANATYVVPAGKTIKFPGATVCTESASSTIKVTAKPGKPVISVS